jgi:uncharacterized protein (TIGR03000 family)
MYSIVMMAAMTTAPETPEFFFKNKGGGCNGCYGGGCYGSCYGSGCYGAGWGYGGCYGGGGCFGARAYGGHAFVGSGCHGAYAGGCGGCGGYAAGYYAPGGPAVTGYGGGGYYYGPGGPGVGVGVGVNGAGATGTGTDRGPGTGTGTGTGTDSGTGGSKGGAGGTGGGKGGATNPGGGPGAALGVPESAPYLPAGRAQVIVRVPADAKLFADGQATIQGGAERVFLTPELSGIRDYQYTLTVEHPAGGDAQTKHVVVRAGHRTVVEFGTVVAAEKVTSPVTVALPEKAKLYVDGVATAAAGGTTTFRTPELTKGKAYVYEFRAEVDKDGKTEVLNRQVTFKGGEPVTVNFVEGSATRTARK